MVRCQRHVSETAERYCDRSALPCLVAPQDPGARAFFRDLAVSPGRQAANTHHPFNTIGRVAGLFCRSTVNRKFAFLLTLDMTIEGPLLRCKLKCCHVVWAPPDDHQPRCFRVNGFVREIQWLRVENNRTPILAHRGRPRSDAVDRSGPSSQPGPKDDYRSTTDVTWFFISNSIRGCPCIAAV